MIPFYEGLLHGMALTVDNPSPVFVGQAINPLADTLDTLEYVLESNRYQYRRTLKQEDLGNAPYETPL